MWGFILSSAALAHYILSYINFKWCHGKVLSELITALGYFSALGSLVWLILGALHRWSEQGKACSGDYVADKTGESPYLWKSGKFMKVYLFILSCLFGLFFFCFIVSAIKDSCSAGIRRCHAHVKQDLSPVKEPLLDNNYAKV